jgi:hypothetical protein
MNRQMDAAVLRDGDMTVVLDGVARLRWSHPGADQWLLCGLWPTGEEQEELLQRLVAGHPLLVLLGHGPATVSVYRREVATELDRFENVIESDPLLELSVPVLDWLPEPLAAHGRDFVVRTDELVRTTAEALLPALIMDVGVADANLLFARRTARAVSAPGCLQAARQVFAARTPAFARALVTR